MICVKNIEKAGISYTVLHLLYWKNNNVKALINNNIGLILIFQLCYTFAQITLAQQEKNITLMLVWIAEIQIVFFPKTPSCLTAADKLKRKLSEVVNVMYKTICNTCPTPSHRRFICWDAEIYCFVLKKSDPRQLAFDIIVDQIITIPIWKKMGAASTKNVFADIVQTLLSKDIDSTEHDFWDELWKTVLSGFFLNILLNRNYSHIVIWKLVGCSVVVL